MVDWVKSLLGGCIGAGGALVSSLCCVLPVTIVLLGLGTGAFMATTMKYTAIFVPVGVASVSAGFYLHIRERQRCARGGCRMTGAAWNLGILIVSALLVAAAVVLTVFPQASADLLLWATGQQGGGPTDMPMPPAP